MFHVEVMRKEDEGLCGRICSGFTHLFYCKDILHCLITRQKQFFFRWQNLSSFSLEHVLGIE